MTRNKKQTGSTTASSENMFRTIAGALLASVVFISVYQRRKAEATDERVSWREEGLPTIIGLRSSGLAMWLSALLYVVNPRWMRWSRVDLPDPTRWSGAVLAAAALPLAHWTLSSLGKNVTPTVATRERHELVTSGPYRWVRHPLYSVGTLFVGSFGLLAANWFVLLSTLSTLVMLLIRLPKEEEKLIERFGDEYRAYMKRTGRMLPRPRGRASRT